MVLVVSGAALDLCEPTFVQLVGAESQRTCCGQEVMAKDLVLSEKALEKFSDSVHFESNCLRTPTKPGVETRASEAF